MENDRKVEKELNSHFDAHKLKEHLRLGKNEGVSKNSGRLRGERRGTEEEEVSDAAGESVPFLSYAAQLLKELEGLSQDQRLYVLTYELDLVFNVGFDAGWEVNDEYFSNKYASQ